MQEDVGLQAATDGEFRRTSWHMDFIYQLGGIGSRRREAARSQFHNEEGELEFDAAGAARRRHGSRCSSTIFGDAFAFLPRHRHDAPSPKLTIPSPSMVHYRGGRAAIDEDVYPDLDAFWTDLTAAYARARCARLGELGCTYLQLDDTSLAYLNDPAQREHVALDRRRSPSTSTRATSATSTRRSPAGRRAWRVTTHMCRGNFRSSWVAEGGYELRRRGAVQRARRRRLLHGVRRRALGRLRAAALRAEGQAGRARARDDQARRARAQGRARSAGSRRRRGTSPLDQLCLSPQCGFSSTVEGNALTVRGAGREAAARRRGRARRSGAERRLRLRRDPLRRAHAGRPPRRRARRCAAGRPRRARGRRGGRARRASTRREIEDVWLGCANQAGEDNRNVARFAALLAGLPDSGRRRHREPALRLGPRRRRRRLPRRRSRATATSSSRAASSR